MFICEILEEMLDGIMGGDVMTCAINRFMYYNM